MGLMEPVQGTRILVPWAPAQLLCNWLQSLFRILWICSDELKYAACALHPLLWLCILPWVNSKGMALLCAVDGH